MSKNGVYLNRIANVLLLDMPRCAEVPRSKTASAGDKRILLCMQTDCAEHEAGFRHQLITWNRTDFPKATIFAKLGDYRVSECDLEKDSGKKSIRGKRGKGIEKRSMKKWRCYSASTNLLPRFFITWGRVVYSMSSIGSRCGSKGPCALM